MVCTVFATVFTHRTTHTPFSRTHRTIVNSMRNHGHRRANRTSPDAPKGRRLWPDNWKFPKRRWVNVWGAAAQVGRGPYTIFTLPAQPGHTPLACRGSRRPGVGGGGAARRPAGWVTGEGDPPIPSPGVTAPTRARCRPPTIQARPCYTAWLPSTPPSLDQRLLKQKGMSVGVCRKVVFS